MQHRHGYAEPFSKASHQLRSQADLGYQHQGAASLCQYPLDELQIHLGFAASGYSVEYKSAVLIERVSDELNGAALPYGQRWAGCLRTRGTVIYLGGYLHRADPSARDQRPRGITPVGDLLGQRIGGGSVVCHEKLEQRALFGRPLGLAPLVRLAPLRGSTPSLLGI